MDAHRAVTITLTRGGPSEWSDRRSRVDSDLLSDSGWPPRTSPAAMSAARPPSWKRSPTSGPNDSDRQEDADIEDMTLDGNAAEGILGTVFVSEVTTAVTTCATCGPVAPIGGLRAYLQAPGAVLRCVTCGAVQVRMVRAPTAPGSTIR